MNYSIEIKNMKKKYTSFKIENLSLKVTQGKIHAIIGASGSGKTVTIKSIVGGVKINDGTILINGQKAGTARANQNLGYVPEFTKFPRGISTYRFLKFLSLMSGIDKKMIKTRLETLMKELGLWEVRKKNMNAFSSGMKKKVMLIQGIIHNPQVLVLDEPEANLDTTTRRQILTYLRKLAESGKTIFFSTHLLNEVKDFIDECSIIYQGRLLYNGSITDFKMKNAFILATEDNESLQKFLKENNIYYVFNKEENNLFLKLNHPLEINKLFLYTIQNNIIIFKIEPYTIDLNFFYAEANKKNSNEGFL